ncbi:hypothetical protein [Sediminibacterium ginsengisoli]|uniref:RloB-like protein n=1 Tax=Sediminibacterium ginsengisoli TaxID=413434 RepID=A0A1T4M5Z0_9BACT|nr:hypothetical protein [Sediminibacterium ginsengisoli]SJZ62287.1 hypothetical protein SAMN04488132_103187 [Sediminibacterium ginsengisoli]
MANKKDCIVLFVEGETEKEFYDALMKFYFKNYSPKIKGYKVFNVRGISRFETKVATKLKYDVVPNHDVSNIKVVCCYDSDAFELAQKPPYKLANCKEKS